MEKEEMEAGLCKLLHRLLKEHPCIHPILAPPKSGLHLQLASHQRVCSTAVLADVLAAAQRELDFRVFLCGYGMKIPAREFYLDVLGAAYSDMASALAYYNINLMLQGCILCGFTATTTL